MKRTLPRELDDLSGMRAARWFRESTAGQWDNFGPDAQREQQDRAIERYGLVDAGLEWSVASSGWTSAWRTATWETMISTAQGGAFDVLVVGYVSRFLRNLKQTLIAVEDHLHTAGVVVLFADERLLHSDPCSWDQFIREAHEAEAYSRKLSKRVSEGYAAKRRRLGVPGGNKMPYGIIREGKPSVLRVDEEKAAVVIRAYQLAAIGLHRLGGGGADRPRQDPRVRGPHQPHLRRPTADRRARRHRADRRPLAVVDGADAAGATTDPDTGSHREGPVRPAPLLRRLRQVPLRRRRALPASAADLRGLPGGEAGRPLSACPQPRRDRHRASRATRYPQEWYEDAVGELLGKVGELDDQAMTEIVRLYGEGLAKPDELTLARIEREREEASQRLAKTRDVAAWQATMARLDAEQQVARQPRQQQRMAPDEVVAYLRSLPSLWTDAGPEGRQALASALFTKLEVEGYTKMRYQLTPDAVTLGLGAALPAQTGDRWSHRWVWSGREDLNLRPQRPERCALPNCATPRLGIPPRQDRTGWEV